MWYVQMARWTSLGLPHGTAWSSQDSRTAYMASQDSNKIQKKNQIETITFQDLASEIALYYFCMQCRSYILLVKCSPDLRGGNIDPTFPRRNINITLQEEHVGWQILCNYLWKIQPVILGICSSICIIVVCIIFKQNVFDVLINRKDIIKWIAMLSCIYQGLQEKSYLD